MKRREKVVERCEEDWVGLASPHLVAKDIGGLRNGDDSHTFWSFASITPPTPVGTT